MINYRYSSYSFLSKRSASIKIMHQLYKKSSLDSTEPVARTLIKINRRIG